MNDQDHLKFEDDLAAYLLDALPGDEARRFERHLDGCPRCQERARWLRPSVAMLPAAVEQVEPPPALRERLMTTVRAEAEPAAVPRRRRSWRDLFAIPRPALAMAAVLLVVVAAGAYALGSSGGGDGEQTVTARGKAPPGATAVVERTGDQGMLRVSGLPQPKNGIYEVWIARDGTVAPSTLFQVHRNGTGAAAIPEGLDGADQVMVTLEPPGGSTKPSREPLIVTNL